ncbi:TPA: YjaA family stress response protein [Providencia rettgeri]
MTLKNLETHEEHTATGEFSSSRLIVGDFFVAEYVLFQLVCEMGLKVRRPFASHHNVVVQALDKNEGGLSMVEERLLTEVTYSGFNHKVKKLVISHDTLPIPQHQANALLSKK